MVSSQSTVLGSEQKGEPWGSWKDDTIRVFNLNPGNLENSTVSGEEQEVLIQRMLKSGDLVVALLCC